MHSDSTAGAGAGTNAPQPHSPAEVPNPERPATQQNYPSFPPYPPYAPQQPYYPAPPIYAPPPGPMPRRGAPWYAWVLGGCGVLVLLVTGSCVVVGVSVGNLFSTLANEKTATDSSSQAFTVTGTPTIVVHDTAGNITIQTGSAGTVVVQTTRRASDTTTQAAQNDLSDITITQTQSGGTITIEADTGPTTAITRQLSADFVITVPAASNLDLQASDGNVEVDGVQGTVNANVDFGNVGTQDVTFGDTSLITVTAGTVDINGALSNSVSLNVEVSNGNATLKLPSSTSAHLDAATTNGSINLTGWSVPVSQRGSGARATGDLGTPSQGQLTIRVTNGDIDISAD